LIASELDDEDADPSPLGPFIRGTF
jgi:hypothetical protein